ATCSYQAQRAQLYTAASTVCCPDSWKYRYSYIDSRTWINKLACIGQCGLLANERSGHVARKSTVRTLRPRLPWYGRTVLTVRLLVRSAQAAEGRVVSQRRAFTVLLGVARWPLPANGHLASGRHGGCDATQLLLCYSACPWW